MNIDEHVNQGLKDKLQKKISPQPNGFSLAELYFEREKIGRQTKIKNRAGVLNFNVSLRQT